jgi:hypothetical protein
MAAMTDFIQKADRCDKCNYMTVLFFEQNIIFVGKKNAIGYIVTHKKIFRAYWPLPQDCFDMPYQS